MWHTEDYNTKTWAKMLGKIGERYNDNPHVVGLEIRSKVSMATYRNDQYIPTWNRKERKDQ